MASTRRGRGEKKGSAEREGEEGGRLTVREREEDRSAARTLRYQREEEEGGSRGSAGTSILYALYRPYQTAGSDVTRATRCLLLFADRHSLSSPLRPPFRVGAGYL